jgi:hypothetical protein
VTSARAEISSGFGNREGDGDSTKERISIGFFAVKVFVWRDEGWFSGGWRNAFWEN